MPTTIGRKIAPIKLDGLDSTAKQYIKDFESKLILKQKSPNTISSYLFSIKRYFLKSGSKITQKKTPRIQTLFD